MIDGYFREVFNKPNCINPYFEYSILKYRPSYLLDERVNIGLLFRFEVEGQRDRFVFVCPNRLGRVSQVFPNLGSGNLNNIKQYLRAFKKIAEEIKEEERIGLKKVIPDAFIVDDANSFFFSEIKKGFYTSIEQTLDYYKHLYFKFYDSTPSKKAQDTLVREHFEQSLKRFANPNDVRLKYFEQGVSIQNKIASSKFKYRWQNGTANLIKTLGFELSDKQDIQDKAFKLKFSNFV